MVGCGNCNGNSDGDWCYVDEADDGSQCSETVGTGDSYFLCNPNDDVLTCDATSPPWMGEAGDCTDSLRSGNTCQPMCGCGYVASEASCTNGVFFPSQCYRETYETCDDSCESARNFVCEDGGNVLDEGGIEDDYLNEFPYTNSDTLDTTNDNRPRRSCAFGTDCHDCGPRRTMWETSWKNGQREFLVSDCLSSEGETVNCGGIQTLKCGRFLDGSLARSSCPGLAAGEDSIETSCGTCEWGPWGECSETCGLGGLKTRECVSEVEEEEDSCVGDSVQSCNVKPCPIVIGEPSYCIQSPCGQLKAYEKSECSKCGATTGMHLHAYNTDPRYTQGYFS